MLPLSNISQARNIQRMGENNIGENEKRVAKKTKKVRGNKVNKHAVKWI